MRNCGICGAPLPANSGDCPSCGTAYTEGGLPSDLLMARPEWGAIKFDLARLENRAEIMLLVKRIWSEMESKTPQALFVGQLAREQTASGPFTLYGPKESFEILVDALGALTGSYEISFHKMEYDEIYRIRKRPPTTSCR